MKILLAAVGKVRGPFADPLATYEARLHRYYSFDAAEVREEPARSESVVDRVRVEEGKRLLARVSPGMETVALHRGGASWSSEQLSEYLAELGLRASPGATFLIGGAYGLSDEILHSATHLLSLSAFTLPHELARLILTEQLYRAGTIARGEPYHKARSARA